MPRSYSQLNTYQRCPKQYEFGYIKKIPRGGISAAESFGSSIHNALKYWGEEELKSSSAPVLQSSMQISLFTEEEPAPIELTEERLLDFFHQAFIVEGYATKKDANEARERGEKLMKKYFAYWSQAERVVVSVESGFKLPLGDVVLTGRFDRVEQVDGGLRIVDFKTSKPREQKAVDEDLQLSVYALACEAAFGQPCKELALQFLSADGVKEVVTTRDDIQLHTAKEEIIAVNGRIEGGEFTATPGKDVCGCCPYANVCDDAILKD